MEKDFNAEGSEYSLAGYRAQQDRYRLMAMANASILAPGVLSAVLFAGVALDQSRSGNGLLGTVCTLGAGAMTFVSQKAYKGYSDSIDGINECQSYLEDPLDE